MSIFRRKEPDSDKEFDPDKGFETWFDQHYHNIYPQMKEALINWQNPNLTREVFASVNLMFRKPDLYESDDPMAVEMLFRLHQVRQAVLTQLKEQLDTLRLYTAFAEQDELDKVVKVLAKFTKETKDVPRRREQLRTLLAEQDSNNPSPT